MEPQEAQKPRRAARRQADQPSTLRGTGSSGPLDSWVHDVSGTGMRIECRAELEIGEEITIGLAGAGATRAHVVWKRGNEYGCQFDEPLSDADAAHAFQGSPVVRLHQFGQRSAVKPPVDEETEETLRIIQDRPTKGRFWMAGLTVAMVATAVPLSFILTKIFG